MQRDQVIGPSKLDLRPYKANILGVPVFPNLEERIVEDPAVARYVCSVLSYWAYSDAETVATIMARLGLERCRCMLFEMSNSAALVRSTGYLVQSHDGRIALLAYRGTDPFDFSTWAVNADVNPATVTWSESGAKPPDGDATRAKPSEDATAKPTPEPDHGIFGFVGGFVNPVLGLVNTVVGGVSTLANPVLGAAGGAVNAVVGGVSTLASPVLGAAGGVVNVVASGVGGLAKGSGELAAGVVRELTAKSAELALLLRLRDLVNSVEDAESALQTLALLVAVLAQVAVDARGYLRDTPCRDDAPKPPEPPEPPEVSVHAGIYRNQRATWFGFAGALRRALDGRSIFRTHADVRVLHENDAAGDALAPPDHKLKHLYVTGHSLGAAMALLAAFRMAADPTYHSMNSVLKHVYAFAPPRVGNGAFASIFDRRLNGRVSCFVYKSDIVPSLPPQLAQSLNFAHVGQFYGVDAAITTSQPNAPDAWLEQEPPERARSAGQLLLALTAAFSSKLDFVQAVLSVLRRPSAENVFSAIYCGLFEERRYSFYDHLPQHYVTASQLPNRRHLTELGDDF